MTNVKHLKSLFVHEVPFKHFCNKIIDWNIEDLGPGQLCEKPTVWEHKSFSREMEVELETGGGHGKATSLNIVDSPIWTTKWLTFHRFKYEYNLLSDAV